MKIEFRKVPLQESNFEIKLDSAIFSGTFCKISPKLVRINGQIGGNLNVDCCKCGKEFSIPLDEPAQFMLSDGVYKSSEEDELLVIEIEDSIIDFEDVLYGELESVKSEYYVCDSCKESDRSIQLEY